MSHFCFICKRSRSNESFSGKGHRIHVCSEFRRLPKAERQAIEAEDEIAGFLRQSRISKKNIIRLGQLSESPIPRVALFAELLQQVAKVTPYKRKRYSILRAKHPDLLSSLLGSGIEPPEYVFDLDCIQYDFDSDMDEEPQSGSSDNNPLISTHF